MNSNTNVTALQSGPIRWALALLCWTIPIVLLVVGLQDWLPPVASTHGDSIDAMVVFLLITTGVMLLAGHILLGYFILRFGRSPQATYRIASASLERKWALIPIVFMSLVAEGGVFVIGLPVWSQFYAAGPPADAVVIEVTGEQFAWNVRYPGEDGLFGRTDPQLITLDNPLGLDLDDGPAKDDRVILGEIFLPVDRAAHVRLRSKDTLHSFFLPYQRVKQDAVPGMTIDIWFVPSETGTFEVACTELCGFGHYTMRGVLNVLSADEFDDRLKATTPFSAYF